MVAPSQPLQQRVLESKAFFAILNSERLVTEWTFLEDVPSFQSCVMPEVPGMTHPNTDDAKPRSEQTTQKW